MDSNISSVPILPDQLEAFVDRANRLLAEVSWTPQEIDRGTIAKMDTQVGWRDSTSTQLESKSVSIVRLGRKVSNDDLFLSEEVNHTLRCVRQGLTIAMHISKLYTQFSGLDQLITLNKRGGLTEQQKAEFRSKYHAASGITVFVCAYYVAWELSQYRVDEVSGRAIESEGIPELCLQDPVRALECLIFYFGALIEHSGQVQSSIDFVAMTLRYFKSAVEEVQRRLDSFQHTESFTNQQYKLKEQEFVICGFEANFASAQTSVEFNRVQLADIVGNRDAKHNARRLVSRLLCYDFETKRNPMFEMGGLSTVNMGFGEPGTGKSMLIAAVATMLSDYCKEFDYPFLFWPMPDTVVSTFQGGSAERMMNWMRALKDPGKIIYAPIDDAENNLEERTRQGVSSGVREVIAVFLRNTEGAYAVNHGNMLIELYTNIPDQIDKAVLSRVNNRAYIGGARSWEDFLDQDHLWVRKHSKVDDGFVNLQDPSSYTYLAAQKELRSLGDVYQSRVEPEEERVQECVSAADHKFARDTHGFFAELYLQMQQRYSFFTSRDVRNIQRAIDSRIMDFDFPELWFENPEKFFLTDYETKKGCIIDLMKDNMKGLSFAEIRYQESIRYLDNLVRISESGRARKITDMVEDMSMREEAIERYGQRKDHSEGSN